jgi:hypothetical protein
MRSVPENWGTLACAPKSDRFRALERPALELKVPILLHSKNFLKQCAQLAARFKMPGKADRLAIQRTTSPRC